MSGKHQRRMWVLPASTGSTSRYDRMHIGVGRSLSTNIIVEQDTSLKALLDYLLEQDTFIKVLTDINPLFDTWIAVFAPPTPSAGGGGERSGRVLEAPIGPYNKRKKIKADQVIELSKIDVSKLVSEKRPRNIKVSAKLDSINEATVIVKDVVIIDDTSAVLNIDLIDKNYVRVIDVRISKEED